jgi:hypothetical protein
LQPSQAVTNSADAANPCSVLLRELIDYAGLFPPASLAMAASVAAFGTYSRSEWNWMLGRFIVPVARLGEFESAFAGMPAPSDEDLGRDEDIGTWRLSALLGPDPVADIDRLREYNTRVAAAGALKKAVVESVEAKVAGPAEIARLSAIIPAELLAYFEIPLSNRSECIQALAESGRRAKIRTGGETADKFPASESVIEFMRLCAVAGVPFKATAGLHHPLRSVHRFTYQAASPSGMMHGFLNVFLAAAFLRAGMETEIAVQLLEEQSAAAFQFDLDAVSWRQHRLGWNEIAAARQNSAISFGSCSFTEPIDDLRSLSLPLIFTPPGKIPAIKHER